MCACTKSSPIAINCWHRNRGTAPKRRPGPRWKWSRALPPGTSPLASLKTRQEELCFATETRRILCVTWRKPTLGYMCNYMIYIYSIIIICLSQVAHMQKYWSIATREAPNSSLHSPAAKIANVYLTYLEISALSENNARKCWQINVTFSKLSCCLWNCLIQFMVRPVAHIDLIRWNHVCDG